MNSDTLLTVDMRSVPVVEREMVGKLLDCLTNIAEHVVEASRCWVALSESTREMLLEAAPVGYAEFFRRLQRIGEGTMLPQLYAVPGRAAAMLGHLPIDEQRHYLQEPVSVVVRSGDRLDSRKMMITALDEQQRLQVFGKTSEGVVFVRSVAQQKTYLAEKEHALKAKRVVSKAEALTRANRWTVEGKRVYVHKAKVESGLTRGDLLQMIKDLG